MPKLLTAIFLLLTIFSCGQTKQNKDKERINAVCDTFMQAFTNGKLEEAVQLLKQNTVMRPASVDSIQVIIANQIQTMFPEFGTMLSAEFVKEKKIKNFITKRFYIIKFSKFFLKVDFTLYNSGTGWTITSFHYNEEADEILE